MHNLETENKKLKQRNVRLENQVLNLGNQINDLEQYGSRQNFDVQGVAMNDDQETPQELEMKVLSVLQHVDGSIDKDDSDVMHILGPRKKKTQTQDMPPIMVRFISGKKRNALFKTRKNLKDAKCDFPSYKGVFLNEKLALKNNQLLFHANKKRKDNQWRYIWTSNGRIFARKSDNSSAIQIKNECDILKNKMKN